MQQVRVSAAEWRWVILFSGGLLVAITLTSCLGVRQRRAKRTTGTHGDAAQPH
ncbi:MAG: hypothetical protein U0528_07710 [Anaerolineae bacterium]